MVRRALTAALVGAGLLLAACTDGTESEKGESGEEAALSGRLVGAAVIGVHAVEVADGRAQEVLGEADFQAGHTATLQAGEPLLHTAHLPLGPEPLTVRTYRLDDGGQEPEPVAGYAWPDTELANRVRALAVSPDGSHYAAVVADGPSTYLEVVDTRTDDVVFSGRDRDDRTLGLVGDDLLWSREHGLVYVADLADAPVAAAGGVVGVALEELEEDGGEVSMSLLQGFDEEAWQAGRPEHLVLSPDGTRLAYAYVPEGVTTDPTVTAHVWVVDVDGGDGGDGGAGPTQLTEGAVSLVGPAFSPDGRHLAVVEHSSRGTPNVYVVDTRGPAPTPFRDRHDTDAVVVATDTRVDTLLGWLP